MVERIKLLVVDTDEEHVEMLQQCAADLDRFEIKVAETQEALMALVREWEPSVVLVDAHVEAVNAVNLLQSTNLPNTLQVVVTSRSNSPDIEAWAKKSGAVGYFSSSGDYEGVEGFLSELVALAEPLTRH